MGEGVAWYWKEGRGEEKAEKKVRKYRKTMKADKWGIKEKS